MAFLRLTPVKPNTPYRQSQRISCWALEPWESISHKNHHTKSFSIKENPMSTVDSPLKTCPKTNINQNIWTLPSLPIPPNRRSTLSLSLRIMQPGEKGCHVSDVLINFDSWGLTKCFSYLQLLVEFAKDSQKTHDMQPPWNGNATAQRLLFVPIERKPRSVGTQISKAAKHINWGWGNIVLKCFKIKQ